MQHLSVMCLIVAFIAFYCSHLDFIAQNVQLAHRNHKSAAFCIFYLHLVGLLFD